MERGKERKEIATETISRRSWLEWAGAGCVLALGGGWLQACTTQAGRPDESSLDGGLPGDGGQRESPGEGRPSFPFQPGEGKHPVFKSWGERTVDQQDLKKILSSWRLQVDGLVENPLELSFAELMNLPRKDMVVDFHCVEGWSIEDVPWNGLHLSHLLKQAKAKKDATYVTYHTIGGKYGGSLPLKIALEPKTLLAYGIGGSTLPLKHGFPLRLVVPRLLAYKSSKYVTRIELTNKAEPCFWVNSGYPYDAEVPPRRLRPGKW